MLKDNVIIERYEKRLKNIKIENGEIEKADFLDACEAPLANGTIPMAPLPDRCELTVKLYPSKESDITVFLSLPIGCWNGKFLGTGNGGAAGRIIYKSVNAGVARGFATANTDMGVTADANNIIGIKERFIDFGYRSTHLMTVVSKQIIKDFYGKEAAYSYFVGGSTGGGQGLHEAQKYPEDYDGIISFSPAHNRINIHQAFIWYLQTVAQKPQAKFTLEQIDEVEKRINKFYAVKSGGAEGDNFISYPGKVNFKPSDVYEIFFNTGLSDEQLKALENLYIAPKNIKTGKEIFHTLPLGCETDVLRIPYIEKDYEKSLCFLHRWVFGKDFDYKTFDFDKDYFKVADEFREILNATNPDLGGYKVHGGKLVLITGSTDSVIPYTDGKSYYEEVVKAQGGLENTLPFFRYFHIPGLGHCSGGKSFQEVGAMVGIPSIPLDCNHDVLTAMMAWVEEGKAPDMLLPVAFKDDKMENEVAYDRPVWYYPYETEYVGGDRTKRESFRKKLGNGVY